MCPNPHACGITGWQLRLRPRQGFTLVELLVVITIIGILMGMTLPAVNQVRELARQSSCRNNLSQIGKALQMYNDSCRMYPFGSCYYSATIDGKSKTTDNAGSMVMLLLPHLDQVALYDMIIKKNRNTRTYSASVTDDSGKSVAANRIKILTLVCPSDPARGMTTASTPLAASNYVGSCGPKTVSSSGCSQGTLYNYLIRSSASSAVPTSNSLYPKIRARRSVGGGLGSGPFVRHYVGPNASKPLRGFRATVDSDVQDGLSCTIFVGESLVECSTWINQGWFSANNGSGITTTIVPINQYTCDTSNEDGCLKYNNYNYAHGFKSFHPGGAQFLFGDGSVHFIPETIDHVTYQYLGAMADGTPVRVPR